MARYVLLVLAGVVLIFAVDSADRSEAGWRRARLCLPATPVLPATVWEPFDLHPRLIGNLYPVPNTVAQNSSLTTFTACGTISPNDTVYGQIFTNSDMPIETATPAPGSDGTNGAWQLVFTPALAPNDDYTLRVCSTGTSPGTSPYSVDCPFSIADNSTTSACTPQPAGVTPSTSSNIQINPPSFPATATGLVTISGKILAPSTKLRPRVIHGEVFTFVNVSGQPTLKVWPAKIVQGPTYDKMKLWWTVSLQVQLPPGISGTQCYKALGCYYRNQAGPAGYATLGFVP